MLTFSTGLFRPQVFAFSTGVYRSGERGERQLVDPDEPQPPDLCNVDALPEAARADEGAADLLERLNRALVALDPGRDQRIALATLDAQPCRPSKCRLGRTGSRENHRSRCDHSRRRARRRSRRCGGRRCASPLRRAPTRRGSPRAADERCLLRCVERRFEANRLHLAFGEVEPATDEVPAVCNPQRGQDVVEREKRVLKARQSFSRASSIGEETVGTDTCAAGPDGRSRAPPRTRPGSSV